MAPLVSVAGYLALLQEPEPELQAHALTNLNQLVDQFWMEIADSVGDMYSFAMGFANSSREVLYEDAKFPQRELAALVLSKVVCLPFMTNFQVFFHLGEYEDALSFALGAGKLFDLSARTEFVETIICTLTSFPD